jgi:hypothetical protein
MRNRKMRNIELCRDWLWVPITLPIEFPEHVQEIDSRIVALDHSDGIDDITQGLAIRCAKNSESVVRLIQCTQTILTLER